MPRRSPTTPGGPAAARRPRSRGANEVAVEAFLERRIPWLAIAEVNGEVLADEHGGAGTSVTSPTFSKPTGSHGSGPGPSSTALSSPHEKAQREGPARRASSRRRPARGDVRACSRVLARAAALRSFVPVARGSLAIIVGIVLMVMLHEAGHFIAARRSGMKATEFFVGFGPRLWSFRRGETEYGVKAIPAGGYVRIIGMSNLEEVDPADEPRTFRRGSYRNAPRRDPRRRHDEPAPRVRALLRRHRRPGPSRRRPEHHGRQVVDAKSRPRLPGCRPATASSRSTARRIGSWDDLKAAIQTHGGEATTFTVVRDGRARRPRRDAATSAAAVGFLGVAPGARSSAASALLAAVPEVVPHDGRHHRRHRRGDRAASSRPSGVEQYTKNFTANAPKAGTPADQERPRSLIGIVDEGSRDRRRQRLGAACGCSARSASCSRCST